MANTTTTPNMNLPVPVPGEDPGPDWANNIVADMGIIDSHNHSPGQGVAVSPDGLNINADLSFANNNATQLRSARFTEQSGALTLPADLDCLYDVSGDLYFNDGAGNNIRMTQGGSVAGSTGTITGLPSGTASASYSAGAFTFRGATNTPAVMNVGPLVIGAPTVSPNTVTLQTAAGQASNIAFTLPLSLPGSTAFMQSDSSGNLSFNSTSIYSGTYTPSVTYSLISGAGTLTTTATTFYYTVIYNIVTVSGIVTYNLTGGSGNVNWSQSVTLPVATTVFTPVGLATIKIPVFGSPRQDSVSQVFQSSNPLLPDIVVVLGSTATSTGMTNAWNFTYQIV